MILKNELFRVVDYRPRFWETRAQRWAPVSQYNRIRADADIVIIALVLCKKLLLINMNHTINFTILFQSNLSMGMTNCLVGKAAGV